MDFYFEVKSLPLNYYSGNTIWKWSQIQGILKKKSDVDL